jgi:hypothetical protein
MPRARVLGLEKEGSMDLAFPQHRARYREPATGVFRPRAKSISGAAVIVRSEINRSGRKQRSGAAIAIGISILNSRRDGSKTQRSAPQPFSPLSRLKAEASIL